MSNANTLPTPTYILDSDQVYEPREDTFLLMDALETELPFLKTLSPSLVLEIGPGSGVVITSLSLALRTISSCLAVDINPIASSTTRKTAAMNSAVVDVMCGDLSSGLCLRNAVDVLIFNPPYVPSEENDEKELIDKAWAGSNFGRSTTDRLFPQLPRLMSNQCVGYVVVIDENLPEEMANHLRTLGFECAFIASRNVRGEKLKILKFCRGLTIG